MSHQIKQPAQAMPPAGTEEKLRKRRQYQQTADEKHSQQLCAALKHLYHVVMVVALGNYIEIYRIKGIPLRIEATFADACRLLSDRIFFQARRGTLANLAHCRKVKGKGRGAKIVLCNHCAPKLSRDKVKKLDELISYLKSEQFVNDFYWQFVM